MVFTVCAGDALSSLKALRDAGRFVGKEDTVPLRLLYSREDRSQISHEELSTRVKASPGSLQVHTHTPSLSHSQVCIYILIRTVH